MESQPRCCEIFLSDIYNRYRADGLWSSYARSPLAPFPHDFVRGIFAIKTSPFVCTLSYTSCRVLRSRLELPAIHDFLRLQRCRLDNEFVLVTMNSLGQIL